MGGFTRNDQRAVIAEFLGTLFFVFIGTGAVVAVVAITGGVDASALVVISVAHGLAILVAVAWTANISGGHINPAVTLAMLVTQKIKPVLGVAYIIAQCAGAVCGSLLLKASIPNDFEGDLGRHTIAEPMARGEALLLEGILTLFLVLVIFNVAVSRKGWGINAPIAIGFSILLIHLVAVVWTGASVNPARSFGPALVENEWKDFWVYIVAPAVGALVAAAAWLVWKDMGDDSLDDLDDSREPGLGGAESTPA